MSEEVAESPFAVLDTVGDDAGDSTEATPAEVTPEEAPAEAKSSETPESEGEEKAEETAKPEAEPETKDGEKAEAEAEEPEPIEGEPPKLKDFLSKHKLAGEEKRWVKKLVYQNREFQEVFPDIREARDFRAAFPKAEDWQSASQVRDAFFRASGDFETNPKAFRDGLKSTSPEAYAKVAEVIAEDIATVAPRARVEIVSNAFGEVFAKLKAEAKANGVSWDQITAEDIENRIFSQEEPTRPDPRVEQILEENRRLKAAQQADSSKTLAAVNSALDGRVNNSIAAEVRTYVATYAGEDFPEKAREKVVSDLYGRVLHAYRTTPSNNHAKKGYVEALARNEMHPDQAIKLLADRARIELKRLGPDVIRNWTEIVVGANRKTVQRVRTEKVESIPATRDVPQMATTPSGPVLKREEMLKMDRGKFWDTVFG